MAPRSEREQTKTQLIKGFCTRNLYEEGPVSMAVCVLYARSAAGPVSVSMAVSAIIARIAAGLVSVSMVVGAMIARSAAVQNSVPIVIVQGDRVMWDLYDTYGVQRRMLH